MGGLLGLLSAFLTVLKLFWEHLGHQAREQRLLVNMPPQRFSFQGLVMALLGPAWPSLATMAPKFVCPPGRTSFHWALH